MPADPTHNVLIQGGAKAGMSSTVGIMVSMIATAMADSGSMMAVEGNEAEWRAWEDSGAVVMMSALM
jgi:hypothetical protein